MEPITIKDVARLSGVGISTVSRAINNHPDINEETKNKIMEVIREYHYVPNNSARNLKRSDSKTIAVLIKGISNPFFAGMLKIFENEIQRKKYSFLLHRVDQMENEVDVAAELIKEKRLKGIVFLGGCFSHNCKKLDQLRVPFVLSTNGMIDQAQTSLYSSISVDDQAESYKIVDYLYRLGHRRIAIIAATRNDESIGRLRLEGYQAALKDNGIEYDEDLCFHMKENIEGYSMANGYSVMNDIMDAGKGITAVYAISDSMAIGACRAVFDRSLRIPDDYSIAGFDGIELGTYYNPTLTTVRQPVEEMAEATIRILFDVIRNKAQHQNLVFQAELVEGNSTRKREHDY